MIKKEYNSPELSLIQIHLQDVILGSPEDLNSQVNSGGWGDVSDIEDFDDEI